MECIFFYRIAYKLTPNEYYMSHQNSSTSLALFIFILPPEPSHLMGAGDIVGSDSSMEEQCTCLFPEPHRPSRDHVKPAGALYLAIFLWFPESLGWDDVVGTGSALSRGLD